MIAVIHRGQKFKETMEAFQQKRAEFIAQEIRSFDAETLYVFLEWIRSNGHKLIKKRRDKLKADIAAQTRNLREADGSIKQFIQEDLQNLAEELRETERQLSKIIVDKDDERYCYIFIKGCSGEDYTGFFRTAGYIEDNSTSVCDSEQCCIHSQV